MISLVVPVYGDGAALVRNAASWEAALVATGEPFEVVIVDDGSVTPVSLPPVLERRGLTHLVRLPRNRGFGPAVNAGARSARFESLLILNDDLSLDPSAVTELRNAWRRADDAGPSPLAVVPRVLSHLSRVGDESAKRGTVEGGLPRVTEATSGRAALFPVGCCFLTQREVFLNLGGFDEAFAPFFWEDVDLGWRGWSAGRPTLRVDSAVAHHEGSLTIRSAYDFETRERVEHRNRLRFANKHFRTSDDRAGFLGALIAEVLIETRVPRRLATLDAVKELSAHEASASSSDGNLLSAAALLKRVADAS